MERFLAQCAQYIFEKHNNELHEICLVFPNRRAGVFFTSYLQKAISSPVIGPNVSTVGELISNYSDYNVADKLQLVSILYDVFIKHTKSTETFDEFYFWGEILLADFNDIDRYLVDAKDIFTNISDLKEIDSVFDYLTEEQKEALEHFWGSVAVSGRKEYQQKHLTIWAKLFPVYSDFKQILQDKKLAYAGMLDRLVIENLKDGGFEFAFKKYYIIGLNALNACERKFFNHLNGLQKAAFLWDYDKSYLDDKKNEAGWFLRDNLKRYPSPADFIFNSETFNRKKEIKLIAVSSVYGQAQQIPVFLDEIKEQYKSEFDNTAIVLADEELLYAALGAVPAKVKTVNVTMGYQVRNSVVYGFLMLLVNLLKNSRRKENKVPVVYHRYVTDVLNHQLLGNYEPEKTKNYLADVKVKNRITVPINEIRFSQIHELLFNLPVNVELYSDYFLTILRTLYRDIEQSEKESKMLLELIFSVYQAIEKLKSVVKNVIEEQQREINDSVYFRLFSQYLGQVSVAFEGEPLSGMQVMGILETRCLDFENIIILGLNENKWPRKFTAPSFIPFNIRKGFGLPGIDEQDAMYAFYFYRLIQRAKNVSATYSVVREGISTGELSRYGYQLRYDSLQKITLQNLDFVFANDPVNTLEIKSSKEIVEKLLAKNTREHPLSPSAINVYMNCSLRFYFRYLVNLPEPDEIKEEIDSQVFGTIFHDTLEALYKPYVGKVVDKADIEAIQKNRINIANEITKQIATHYFKQKIIKKPVVLEGKTLLIFENIKTYLKRLFNVDKEIAPFSLIGLEKAYQNSLSVNLNGKQTTLRIGGKIDRIDRINGKVRILDYKTGNVKALNFKEMEDVFLRDVKEPKKEVLQALIYSWAFLANSDETEIQPAIYSLRKLFDENFHPNITHNKNNFDWQLLKPEFVSNLTALVEEIYSENNSFVQTEHLEKCAYCPYNKICQRF